MKGFPFFKKQQQAGIPNKEKEIETAVLLVQYVDGGATVGILKIDGVKKRRDASINDLYRMCCEVKGQVEQIRVVDRISQMLMPTFHKQPEDKPNKTEKEGDVTQKAEEEKK